MKFLSISACLIAVSVVATYMAIVPSIRAKFLDNRKERLVQLMDVALSLIETEEGLARTGAKSLAIAQGDAMRSVAAIRYGEARDGYFWIMDSRSVILAHRAVPDLIGKERGKIGAPYEGPLSRVMDLSDKVIRERKPDFIEYDWPLANESDPVLERKLSRLVFFEPWGWILGTGIFIGDIEQDIQGLMSRVIGVGCLLGAVFFLGSAIYAALLAQQRMRNDRMEGRLAESRGQFETIFDENPQSLAIVERVTNTFRRANRAFEVLAGMDSSGYLGKTPVEIGLMPAERFAMVNAAFRGSRARGEDRLMDLPVTFSSARGERRDVLLSSVPIRFGGEDCTLNILQDMSDFRKLQEELVQAQKMETVGQLAGGVAHDFNNMLAGIMGGAERIGMDLPEESPALEYVGMIKAAAKRASGLTSKLLAFSRRGKTESAPFDALECIESVIALLEHSIDKRIEIKRNFQAESSRIRGDASLIQNALLNIAINARDAMPSGGTIVFSARTAAECPGRHDGSGPYLVIEVSDTGIGIPETIMPRIFDPFFTTKAPGQGTGLGLSAVYAAVNDHGGSVDVKSREGAGSVFAMYLPLATDAPEPVADAEGVVSGSGSILVVDDEKDVRDVVAGMLERLGYAVAKAESGASAVELFRKDPGAVDLAILDIIMPKMSGKETFVRLKEMRSDLKAIFISGYNPEGSADDLESMGASGFVRKPFGIAELSQAVASALRGTRGPPGG